MGWKVVFGDIHGRNDWKKILETIRWSKVIFLGDYVSTHDSISEEEQIENLKEILALKKRHPERVFLCRGNHDMQHLGYYWAECCGYFSKVSQWMQENKEEFLNATQWVYIDEDLKTIFSHGGVSKVWLENNKLDIYKINELEPSELFGFIPDHWGDNYGDSPTQPPTWIRPTSLVKNMVDDWNQVVGHTPQDNIKIVEHKDKQLILCDTMPNYYLKILKDGNVIIKDFKKIK